jgi:hypothetical protein
VEREILLNSLESPPARLRGVFEHLLKSFLWPRQSLNGLWPGQRQPDCAAWPTHHTSDCRFVEKQPSLRLLNGHNANHRRVASTCRDGIRDLGLSRKPGPCICVSMDEDEVCFRFQGESGSQLRFDRMSDGTGQSPKVWRDSRYFCRAGINAQVLKMGNEPVIGRALSYEDEVDLHRPLQPTSASTGNSS